MKGAYLGEHHDPIHPRRDQLLAAAYIAYSDLNLTRADGDPEKDTIL